MPSRLLPRLPRIRWTRRRIVTWSVVGGLVVALLVWGALPSRASYTTRSQMLTVMTGPSGSTPIQLDTTFYLPRSASAAHPVPAVLLAHGFGGTKDDVTDQAEHL